LSHQTAASDYFRSLTSGNWGDTSSWQSSVDNSTWISSSLIPGSSEHLLLFRTDIILYLNQNTTIPGLTINNGGTFTASDGTARTLTITKSTSGSSTTLANNGTWATGTGGSTVVFTGAPSSGDATHAITGTIAFQNITVNKTGGSSNVGAGFAVGSSVSGTLQIGNGGFISTDPPASFYGENAILAFNQGSGANYEVNSGDKTWSTTIIPNNITVSSGTVILNDNRTATGSLIISSDAVLTINATKQLSVNTGFTNNGTLNLLSSASGTATILTPATSGGIPGTFSVQQYLSSARNWYVSSPVSNALAPSSGYTLYNYNEAGSSWGSTVPSFTKGVGYIALPGSIGSTLTFATQSGGKLNSGNVDVTLTRSGTSKTGFNLIGNPYPAHLGWTYAFTNANSTLIEPTIWYRTNSGTTNDSHLWSFVTYNVISSETVPSVANAGIIPPMQAFWVRALQAGTLTLDNKLTLSHQNVESIESSGS